MPQNAWLTVDYVATRALVVTKVSCLETKNGLNRCFGAAHALKGIVVNQTSDTIGLKLEIQKDDENAARVRILC